ncbi:MAG: c-type cytochrome [Proteobacteria bacterium]|nr:c-type cytochrome [Pseudomonadota bacterium]
MNSKLFIRKKPITLIGSLLLVLLGVVLWGGFNTTMEATNTLKFCISCHEMENTVYQDYRHSVHASNPSGVRASCPDCHVPKEWFPKVVRKIQASAEVYHWLAGTIDTQEKFAARRPYLAKRVWTTMKNNDSQECRNCHKFDSMDLTGQARFAARIHRDGMAEGKTCIDCHKGIAHQLPAADTVEIAGLQGAELKEALDYGEEINETCAGCHGENAQGSIDGEYPRLAGMSIPYLSKQLHHFKTRDRLNIPMVPYTNDRELPEDDIQAIVQYISSIKLPTRLSALEENTDKDGSFDALGRLEESRAIINIARYPGNLDSGKRAYRKECATCHGRAGEGSFDGMIPPLTGQHSVYLKRQIENFRKSERVHDAPGDAEIFKQFGDSEIDDILAFLSIQDD